MIGPIGRWNNQTRYVPILFPHVEKIDFPAAAPFGVSLTRRAPRIDMKDLQTELEKLLVNAEDCELIARLATDHAKRVTFGRIAKQLRKMAAELEADMSTRSVNAS